VIFCGTYFTPVVDNERGFGSILPVRPKDKIGQSPQKPILIGITNAEMAFVHRYIDYLSIIH